MLKCSHILFKVNNIKQTVENLTQLGFTMHWGSAPEKAHNAILWFNKGPFIEFFQMPAYAKNISMPLTIFKGRSAGKRWLKWVNSPQGWCDIALEPTDENRGHNLKTIQKKIEIKGLKNSKIINNKRTRPDGKIVKYSFMSTFPSSLPFIVSLYDPPQCPKNTIHKNGAFAVQEVCLELPKKEALLYYALCNNDPWIKIKVAENSKISGVSLNGFSKKISKELIYDKELTK